MSLSVAGGASQTQSASLSFGAGVVASIIALAAVSFVGGKRTTTTVESSAPR